MEPEDSPLYLNLIPSSLQKITCVSWTVIKHTCNM